MKLTWAPTGTLTIEPTEGSSLPLDFDEARRRNEFPTAWTIFPRARRSSEVDGGAWVREVFSSPALLPTGRATTRWPKRRVRTKAEER